MPAGRTAEPSALFAEISRSNFAVKSAFGFDEARLYANGNGIDLVVLDLAHASEEECRLFFGAPDVLHGLPIIVLGDQRDDPLRRAADL